MRDVLQEYWDYLKDNPEGYWFKRKLYGWGWTPATWQGWFCIAVYVFFLLLLTTSVDKTAPLSDVLFSFFLPVVFLTAALIGIAFKTGEKPRWQWGISRNEDRQ